MANPNERLDLDKLVEDMIKEFNKYRLWFLKEECGMDSLTIRRFMDNKACIRLSTFKVFLGVYYKLKDKPLESYHRGLKGAPSLGK
jgi:hypothetical protein